MLRSPLSLPKPLFVLALALCGCASDRGAKQEVRWLVDHGRYEEAVRKAADMAQDHPRDEKAQALHREATIAYLLEKGRRATFEDQDVEALQVFEEARAIAPDSSLVATWIDKTKRKLAARWRDVAFELLALDEMDAALEAYDKALAYEPGYKAAIEGRTLAQLVIAHRQSLGSSYFNEGLHALADYWLEVARSRFGYSKKYARDDERPMQRRRDVDKLLAQQRLSLAQKYEADRRYGAARTEYRLAVMLDPGNKEAAAGVERCAKEQAAAVKLAQVDMELVRGRFGPAVKLVDEAAQLTIAQQDRVEGKNAAIREARLERAYQNALALERDDRFEEAVKAYADLLKQVDYYKDVLARKDTLEEYIRLAAELYEKANAAQTPEERLDYLQRIRVFWPEYRDVSARVHELEAELTKPSDS